MKQRYVNLTFLSGLFLMVVGCTANRTNLRKSGSVTIENHSPGKVKVLWSDAYEEGGQFTVNGMLGRNDRIAMPIAVHVHVFVLSGDGGRVVQTLKTSDIAVPRNRIGRCCDRRRFAVEGSEIPSAGSKLLVVAHSHNESDRDHPLSPLVEAGTGLADE